MSSVNIFYTPHLGVRLMLDCVLGQLANESTSASKVLQFWQNIDCYLIELLGVGDSSLKNSRYPQMRQACESWASCAWMLLKNTWDIYHTYCIICALKLRVRSPENFALIRLTSACEKYSGSYMGSNDADFGCEWSVLWWGVVCLSVKDMRV